MHSNIVNVYDVGEENDIYYIVMELVEGITLKKYIEKKARLSVKEAVSIAIQVSMGIEAAHNNHIIHRDIKPQNIIISKEGKVKVTDFGIAKAATSNTITSNVMGSVHYTSPEQARGGYSDEKSDIYSMGITLFEMLTGRVPFNGETTVAIAIKHIQEALPSPRDYVTEIPVSVEQIVLKCCQKSPDRRYQTMADLIADLKKSLISPEEDFVKMVSPDEEATTRAITDQDMQQIKRQSIQVIRREDREDSPRSGQNIQRESREAVRELVRESVREGSVRETKRETVREPMKEPGREPVKEAEREPVREAVREPLREVREPVREAVRETPRAEERPVRRVEEPSPKAEVSREEEEEGSGYDSRMERMTTVLAIVAAVLIGCIVLFLVGKTLGILPFGKETEEQGASQHQTQAQEEQQPQEMTPVEMPEVVGRQVEEVKQELTAMGLTPEVTYRENTNYEEGLVLECNIGIGRPVDSSTKILLTVSAGFTGIEVPDVVGQSKAQAVSTLKQKSFVVNTTESYDEQVPKDHVISQSPEGGTKAPSGSAVAIKISKGAEDTKVRVPNLIGETEKTAMAKLTELGLPLGSVSKVNNEDTSLTGLVCYQSYSVGSYVDKGTAIDLRVSIGPKQPSYSYTGNIQAPTAEEDPQYVNGLNVQVTVDTADGVQLLSTATTSFPIPVNYNGIKSQKGTITFHYTVTTEPTTYTDPQTGETITTEGATEQRMITREVEFTLEG